MKKRMIVMLMAAGLLSACEKPIIDGVDDAQDRGNLTLRFSPYSLQPMTRSAAAATQMTKLNLQLFRAGTSEKVFDKVKTQTAGDAAFGTMSLSVAAGSYDVLCVGHSSERSATLTREKVSFTAANGRKLTDTFWCQTTVTATEDGDDYLLAMDRAVAMFRLVITDDIPDNVSQLRFDYTGGSADFNPQTGVGVTNSKQSELRDVSGDTYEVYTFPKGGQRLKLTVSALDAAGAVVAVKQFEDVPVQPRHITEYRGTFFDGGTAVISGNTFAFTVNDQWEGIEQHEF